MFRNTRCFVFLLQHYTRTMLSKYQQLFTGKMKTVTWLIPNHEDFQKYIPMISVRTEDREHTSIVAQKIANMTSKGFTLWQPCMWTVLNAKYVCKYS